MQDGLQGNAMTEVALALAMGFFSILVLALVSMGAGGLETTKAEREATLLQPALLESSPLQQGGLASASSQPDDQIVIYHRGQLLDAELAPLDPGALAPDRRVVLALAPDVPLAEIMAAYSRFNRPDLVVAGLDERWINRLAALESNAVEAAQ